MTQLEVQSMPINETLPFSFDGLARIVGERRENGKIVDQSSGALGTRETSPSVKQTQSDLALIQALRNKEEAAFSTLIGQYHSKLLRLARAFVPSEAVAEEVVQETWLGVLEGINSFEGRSSLKTWVFRILINRAKTRGQREKRYVPFSEVAAQADEEPGLPLELDQFYSSGHLTGTWKMSPTPWDDHTPERLLLSKEGVELIEKAIQKLPANQRQIIILHDIEGIDSEDICASLNINAAYKRVLLHRARAKVRTVLDHYQQGG